MKSFFVTLIALGGLLSSSIASPVASPVDVSKRQEAAAIGYLNNLYASVQTYTAEMSKHPSLIQSSIRHPQLRPANPAIDAIISTVTVASSQADKDAATAAIGAQIQGLTSAVTSTTANVKTLTPVKRSVEARQTPADITAILVAVLNQVFGALTNIVAILGLSKS